MSGTTGTTTVGMDMREFERQLQHVRDAAATLGVFAVSEGIDGMYPGFGMALEGMAGSLLDTTRAIDAAGWQHAPRRSVQNTQDAPRSADADSDGHELIYRSAEDTRDGLRSIAADLRDGTAGADAAERLEDAAGWLDFEVENEGLKLSEAMAISEGTGVTLDRLYEIVCQRHVPEEK
jgi:hypothetical protein